MIALIINGLLLISQQSKLSVEQCHYDDDGENKHCGESQRVKHLHLQLSDLGLVSLNRLR